MGPRRSKLTTLNLAATSVEVGSESKLMNKDWLEDYHIRRTKIHERRNQE